MTEKELLMQYIEDRLKTDLLVCISLQIIVDEYDGGPCNFIKFTYPSISPNIPSPIETIQQDDLNADDILALFEIYQRNTEYAVNIRTVNISGITIPGLDLSMFPNLDSTHSVQMGQISTPNISLLEYMELQLRGLQFYFESLEISQLRDGYCDVKLHRNILIAAGGISYCVQDLKVPALQAEYIVAMLAWFKAYTDSAANFLNITIRGINLSGKLLDLSIFPNLRKAKIEQCSLNKLPIFSGCSALEVLELGSNSLSLDRLPDTSANHKLRILDLTTNPLQQVALNQGHESKKGSGLRIIFDSKLSKELNTFSEFVPAFQDESTLLELLERFFSTVEKPKVNEESVIADVRELKSIAFAFGNRIMALQVKEDSEFVDFMLQCKNDSLLQSKFALIMNFMRSFAHNNKTKDLVYDEEDVPEHYTSNNVWRQSFSFLSAQREQQMPMGKERATECFMFPKGMAKPMIFSYLQEDIVHPPIGVRAYYLSPEEKRLLKLRLVDSDKQPLVLYRELDRINGRSHAIPGDYLYAFSMHGGLVASHCDSYEAEFDIHNHSVFRAGQYVVCTGRLTINDQGQITSIDSDSGHIKPTELHLYCFAAYLYAKKMISEDCLITAHGRPTIKLSDLLNDLEKYVPQDNIRQFIRSLNKLIVPPVDEVVTNFVKLKH